MAGLFSHLPVGRMPAVAVVQIERGSMEEAFSSMANSTQLDVPRAAALSSVVIDSETRRTPPTLQAVPVLAPTASNRA